MWLSPWNPDGSDVAQSKSALKEIFHVSVPAALPLSDPVNVSTPCPQVRPVVQLMMLENSVVTSPARLPV